MVSDGVFFVGILLFFFLLWFVSGGPTRPISFAGPYITPITDTGTVQEGYANDSAWFGFGSSFEGKWFGSDPMGGGSSANTQSEIRRLEGLVSDLQTFGESSPYRNQVSITGVSSSVDVDNEYITIQLSRSAPSPVTVSGWRVRSDATRNSATIPSGTELPKSGVNSVAPITLQPGDTLTLTTGDSPIGVSFRENTCVGYFAQRQSFVPSLQSSCPSPLDEFERYYEGNKLADDECYDYVRSLEQCTAVPNPPSDLSRACRELVDERLDYSGCVATHRNDADFSDSRWRAYLERSGTLWKTSREAIKLIDNNGKTVDLYTY